MRLLYQWGVRLHRENPLHTLITVIDLVFTFSLIYSTSYIVNHSIWNHGTDGIGLMWYISILLMAVLVISSVLTMYNAFSVTIQERMRHYETLSTCGATVQKMRRGLYAEAVALGCVGLVLGISMGMVICSFLKLEDPVLPDHLQKVSPRRIYGVAIEFLAVMGSMTLACRRHLNRLHQPRVSQKQTEQFNGMFRTSLLRHVFRLGGRLSVLLHRHDKKTRASFLPALVMSIVSLLILSGVFNNLSFAQLVPEGADMYLRTLGRKGAVETAAAQFFEDPQTLRLVRRVDSYQCYMPCAYCLLTDNQITPQVQRVQSDLNPFWMNQGRVHVYRSADRDAQLVVLNLVFLKNDDFRAFAHRQHVSAGMTDGIWLRDLTFRGKPIEWLTGAWEHETLEMRFYTSDRRFEIGAKKQKTSSQERAEQKEITPCKNADDYLAHVQDLPTDTLRVQIAGIAEEPETLFWDLDCVAPTLVFSEQAKETIFKQEYLDGACIGSSYTVVNNPKTDPDGSVLAKRLSDALRKESDGFIADHVFGEGTRYIAGATANLSDKPVPNRKVPPRPIHADLHAQLEMWPQKFQSNTLPYFFVVFTGLTLFTLFTNIVNVVFANHILYRREYAMLESIGMDDRQKRSLILYEGVRYSLYTVLYSVLCTLLLYPAFSMAVSYGLHYELLCGNGDKISSAPAVWSGYFFRDLLNALYKTVLFCGRNWMVFLGAGLVTYGIFFLTNTVTSRRMRIDELIPLLKREQ